MKRLGTIFGARSNVICFVLARVDFKALMLDHSSWSSHLLWGFLQGNRREPSTLPSNDWRRARVRCSPCSSRPAAVDICWMCTWAPFFLACCALSSTPPLIPLQVGGPQFMGSRSRSSPDRGGTLFWPEPGGATWNVTGRGSGVCVRACVFGLPVCNGAQDGVGVGGGGAKWG